MKVSSSLCNNTPYNTLRDFAPLYRQASLYVNGLFSTGPNAPCRILRLIYQYSKRRQSNGWQNWRPYASMKPSNDAQLHVMSRHDNPSTSLWPSQPPSIRALSHSFVSIAINTCLPLCRLMFLRQLIDLCITSSTYCSFINYLSLSPIILLFHCSPVAFPCIAANS